MSNDPKATPDAQSASEHTASPLDGTEQQAQDGSAPEAAAPQKHHDDIIAELRREVADLKDRILRAHAEVDNIRKRSEREKDETAKYAVTKFARDVLNVGDNFQRALTAVPAGAAETDTALKALVDGVVMTEREFMNVLERHGVKRIEAENAIFNPHLHQAVMEMPKPDVPAGTIVQVFQAGFTIGDRTLRPSMVVVASGGPKPQKPSDASTANGNDANATTGSGAQEPPAEPPQS